MWIMEGRGRVDPVALEVSYAVFGVVDDEEWPDERPSAHTNGLVRSMSRGVLIATGIHTGAIAVSARPLKGVPSAPKVGGWDEVVEISFVAESGDVRVAALMDDAPESLPNLVTGPGSYRLRVHARGRDSNPDGVAEEPVEEYLLMVWPAPMSAEQVFKASDTVGELNRRHARTPVRLDPGWEVAGDVQYEDDEDDEDDEAVRR
ncbi:MAG TPA: hypothetical protein VLL08_25805 [Kineosporiaceae bacterium]|nr:hypothetical protein [Kineosporiaceae bacterium]